MRFLITCYKLDLSGSSTYTFTLASELKRKGHEVNVFSPFPEIIADELKKKEIRIYKTLEEMSNEKYTFIIAQHNILALMIRSIKPEVPMVFISHGILPSLEQPPSININIQKYVAVSEEVKNNLILNHDISSKSVDVIRNFVDVSRFFPQRDISERPRVVLVISNRLSPEVYETIKEACEELSLELIFIGRNRQVVNTEDYINKADIIISLGRGILEGMACGRAAIVYDYQGADGMITPSTINEIRKHNFSGRRFKVNYDVRDLIREIRKYDKSMGEINRELVLKDYDVSVASDRIINICNQIQKNFYLKPINMILPTFNSSEISLTNNKIEEHRSRTVSIIIPVFNNLPYTTQCLQSLFENKTKKSYQLIIVDNGSTDGTKEFLKCLSGSVKIISNRENLG
ncbi:MAG: glycosyltransferase, partial [Phycisphaerae bacterium]